MDLKKIRKKTGLSEKQFVVKLKPSLDKQGRVLTESMLVRIERGETVSEDRIVAILEGVKEAFPEFSDQTITATKRRLGVRLSANLVALIGFVILSVVACGFYFFTDEKQFLLEILTIVASVAGVIGLVYTVHKVSS